LGEGRGEGFNLLTVAGLDSATGLYYTELEAAAIGQLFGNSASRNRLLNDEAATETAVKAALAEAYQVLHFSGHGAYDQKHPNLSAIFLSGEDRLTSEEIASLSLSSYVLAYINACETGITDMETIDTEYVGLVSAFLRAGVAQVISSLWPVNDESSALLGIKFYQEYLGGEPATVALANAKSWLREEASWGEIARIYQQCWDNGSDDSKSAILETALRLSQKKNSDEIPFQDAYYWSGVVISG
jgi:CHAT domain-containing protein